MATKSGQYQQVLDNIAAGDPMAAYTGFTQLPFSEQMMLYMTPGVGDAIAYVESADFFDKAGKARQEGRYGDMIGSGLSGGIAAASMLPFAGSVIDAARVGGKTLERGIGSLMNRVNARMDDGIPGGGGGSRGGGSGPFDEIYKLSDTESSDFTKLPEELVKRKGNAVIAKHFEDMGFDKNSIKVFDEDTNYAQTMDLFDNVKRDPGSTKSYKFKYGDGEEAIEQVETFTVNGQPMGRFFGSDGHMSGPWGQNYTAYFIPKQGATASKNLTPGSVNDKRRSQLLFDLKRERMIQQKSVNDLVEMEGSKKAEAKIIAELKKLDAADP